MERNETKNKKIKYNCEEEFKTSNQNITEKEMLEIFNKKLYNYIKKKEKSLSKRCDFV